MKTLIALNLALIALLTILTPTSHSFVVSGAVLTPSRAILTAYSSEESQTDSEPEIMASGKRVYKGAIACPRKYPFGQQVEIAGKTYTCEDRKNIRYESYPEEWFDIWFESRELAINFGVKSLEIVVK